ncbi:MAG TPA: arginine--tRNA ligase [Candidatus Pacearchaeota archaeon]|nr:arginine--tRNA ligase [Candidatus Pacearchaeota archaeon]HPR79836.1 arginine--tRNA ligase [Candidatus Pacearchaeota archaeon]
MNIREEIKNSILKSIEFLDYKGDFSVKVLKSQKSSSGDYFVNIAMEIAKKEGKDPMEIAKKIKDNIKGKYFEKIEVMSPGFINFFISKEYFLKEIREALKRGNKFGHFSKKKEKIQIEFISANPTGPLTVSQGREGIFGDVLTDVFKRYGFNVKKSYYINDQEKLILILGHSVLKDDEAEYNGEYIDRLHKSIKSKDPFIVGKKAAKIIMQKIIKKTIRKLKIKFDEWTQESVLSKNKEADKIFNLLKDEGLIYEQEGAEWFMSTALGDERDRMVIKSDGEKNYLLDDIAYHKYKFEKKKFDKIIDIRGTDYLYDFPGLLSGVEATLHINKLQAIFLQSVVLVEGGKTVRMSKKGGEFIVLDDLTDELPVDVIRFFFLMESAENHLNFDLDLAKDISEKNPVFYIQNAYAKISRILKGLKNILGIREIKNVDLLNSKKEIDLMRQILRFPEIIEDTVHDCEVQRIPQYAIDLVNSFYKFYTRCYISTKDKKVKEAQLSLIVMTKIVLKNTLDLMGISAPGKI